MAAAVMRVAAAGVRRRNYRCPSKPPAAIATVAGAVRPMSRILTQAKAVLALAVWEIQREMTRVGKKENGCRGERRRVLYAHHQQQQQQQQPKLLVRKTQGARKEVYEKVEGRCRWVGTA